MNILSAACKTQGASFARDVKLTNIMTTNRCNLIYLGIGDDVLCICQSKYDVGGLILTLYNLW